MATLRRRNARPVIQVLNAQAHRFNFLQAVRVLETYRRHARRVGESAHPEREAVKFRGNLGFAFPATDIDRMNVPATADAQPLMTVNFMGLGGAFGPLPAPISELILTRMREGETAGRDFLDIFNHRLVSLLMRLRRNRHAVLQADKPDESELALALYALLGLGTDGARQGVRRPRRSRLGDVDRGLPALAGLLHRRPIAIHTLERAIGYHFGLPVRCKALRGAWMALDLSERTAIGARGRNRRLGESAVLGRRVWSQEAEIRLEFGPLTMKEASRLLPTGDGYQSLKSLLLLALSDAFDCKIVLVVAPEKVVPLRLGHETGARLGWTSWLPMRQRNEPGVVALSADWFRPRPEDALRRALSERFAATVNGDAEGADGPAPPVHGEQTRGPA